MSGQIRPLLFSASCSSPLTAAASELWCKLAMVAEAAMAVASFRKVQRERERAREVAGSSLLSFADPADPPGRKSWH